VGFLDTGDNSITVMEDRYTEMEIRLLFARNLKRLRELKRISQLTLSSKTGLTHNFINDIENCTKWVSAKTIARMASALEVEPYQLFLPEFLPDDTSLLYLREFQDSLQVFVKEYTEHYKSPQPEKKNGKGSKKQDED
jgi:transcriptional regulator with XRE-family HTH domain